MERALVEQPPAKRMRLAVPVRGGGGGGGGGGEVASPRTRRLRQTLLVVLFLVRASARTTVTASISRIGGMIDRAFLNYHGMMSSMLDMFQSKLDAFQVQVEGLRQEVRQLACLHSNRHLDGHAKLEPNKEHAAASRSNTNIHLRFLNNWKPPIYTDRDITDGNNAAIKVAVFEDDKMITTGPLSKAEIEILVLHGSFYKKFCNSWTEEDFDKYIVQGRDEQGLVLGTVRLNNGEAVLSQIRVKEGSCRKKFSMAARVCKSQKIAGRVQEAIMEPVEVKDRRNESNEKSNSPRLDDDVYRLEGIARNGTYHRRLKKANIHTVQDFLKALNKDSNELFKILKMKKKGESWSKMTGHARKCILEDRKELKMYKAKDSNVALFFNCVHNLVGARIHGNYAARENFDTHQKALVNKVKDNAYTILEGIPSDYVMRGNAPERISAGTDVAAGPSILPVNAGQPYSLAQNQAYQGSRAAKNWPCDDSNFVSQQIYQNAKYGPMNTGPDNCDLNTYDYQDQGIPPQGQHQMISPLMVTDWQQNAQGLVDSPNPFEFAGMNVGIYQHPSGASTSAQPNFEPHQLLQHHQMVPAAAPPWPGVAAAEPSFVEQDQGPNYSAFGNGFQ